MKPDSGLEQKLSELVERLKKALGEPLISVILYGSATTDDYQEERSDLNVLCVLSRLSTSELETSEATFEWWRGGGNPPPLLLTEEEVRNSTDCFPMEFHDMAQYRRVLYGTDVIRDLKVDNKFYRAQVEHELRAKQIRLRQRAAEVLQQPERLQRLMTDSISTFCVLGRHALLLSGQPPQWKKREILAALGGVMGRPLAAADEILAIRLSGKQVAQGEARQLLDRYLGDVEQLVRFVDGLEY